MTADTESTWLLISLILLGSIVVAVLGLVVMAAWEGYRDGCEARADLLSRTGEIPRIPSDQESR